MTNPTEAALRERYEEIIHRLNKETGLFCDDKSLAQYNDLVYLAKDALAALSTPAPSVTPPAGAEPIVEPCSDCPRLWGHRNPITECLDCDDLNMQQLIDRTALQIASQLVQPPMYIETATGLVKKHLQTLIESTGTPPESVDLVEIERLVNAFNQACFDFAGFDSIEYSRQASLPPDWDLGRAEENRLAEAVDDAKNALLSAISRLAQGGQSTDESAWLIEWHFQGVIHYVGVAAWGEDMPEMSTVHNALRFARKVDAENVAGYLRRQARYKNYDLKINEHVWHTPTTTERAGA